MYALIIGGGNVGQNVLTSLIAEDYEVAIVEKAHKVCGRLHEEYPRERFRKIRIICDDGCDPRVLEEANIQKADILAAITGNDEDNLVAAFLAKKEYGVP